MATVLEPEVDREQTPPSQALPETPPVAPLAAPRPAFDPLPSTTRAARESERPQVRLGAVVCFGVSILTFVIGGGLGSLGLPSAIVAPVFVAGAVLFGLSIVMALFQAARGIVLLVRPQDRTVAGTLGALAGILGHLLMAGFGMLVAYFSTVGFSRGRQLRRFGRVQLPGLRSHSSWTTAATIIDGHEDVPAGVADQWRENGKTEHASVAAFARLTLDLMALGAPPRLVAAANQDALDEIRHTELCFSLAHALDGKAVSPAPFPQAQRVGTLPRSRILALARLAVDSLVDGALHEGVSARVIAKLARRTEVPAIRAALKEIAADEGRHTAHGWAVMEWCLDEGGSAVAGALLGALRTLPSEMSSELPEAAADGGWERWGIHGRALESEEYRAARAHLVERVRATVAASVKTAA